MKKLFEESIIKNLYEKWNIVVSPKNDDSKYGNIDIKAMVQNDILGHCTIKEIMELEKTGSIIFQNGKWKIKTQAMFITAENKNRFHAGRNIGEVLYIPSDAWIKYMDSKKYVDKGYEEKTSFNQLVLES